MKRVLALVVGISAGVLGLAGSASAQTAANQRFIVFQSGSGGQETSTVVAVGPITGVGTLQQDPNNEDIVRFVFPNGTITLNAPNDDESDTFDERTCSGSFTFRGPFTVIGATGAFAGARGSGRFEGQGLFVGVRGPQGCSENEDEGVFFLFVNATGNVSLPARAAA